MKKIAESVLAVVSKDLNGIKNAMCMKSGDIEIYPASVHKIGDAAVMMGRNSEERFLLVVAYSEKTIPAGFAGEKIAIADGGVALVGKLDSTNAAAHKGFAAEHGNIGNIFGPLAPGLLLFYIGVAFTDQTAGAFIKHPRRVELVAHTALGAL